MTPQDIISTAKALGMSPIDLATIMHYESGFNENVWGGQGGQHFGSIQFGPAERQKYGVNVKDPSSQFVQGAVYRYFTGRGWKWPGLEDTYHRQCRWSGRGRASDTAAGGRAGNVSQKVASKEMAASREAETLLGMHRKSLTPLQAAAVNLNEARLDTPSLTAGGQQLPGPEHVCRWSIRLWRSR
jgi:hypothetical protein